MERPRVLWDNKGSLKHIVLFLASMLIVGLVSVVSFPASAGSLPALEITGDGVENPIQFTLAALEELEQYQHVYSTINTWPNKRWYTGEGVKLRDLLAVAGIKEGARLIKFVSTDGYEVTLTVKELLKDSRYYFPGLKENHPHDGSIPGSPERRLETEPIVALRSAEDSDNPDHMTGRDCLQLLFGQRAVTEQTNNLFLKYVCKIEVLTTAPEKWDNPRANIPDGTLVPKGTMLTLNNKLNNEDKIYYTTDGSTPTVESPIFNWSASRWWSLREDLDNINSPIEITGDTIIKAITIGPGREDSEVVTFTFQVDPTGQAVDPTTIPGGPPTGITLDRNDIELKPGSAYQLEATVAPFNAANQDVNWCSSDTSVAAVDARGLVTVVGPGTATITVTTADGNHTASAVVSSFQGKKDEEDTGVEDSDLQEEQVQDESIGQSTEVVPSREDNELQLDGKDTADSGTTGTSSSTQAEGRESNAETPEDEMLLPDDEEAQYLADKPDLAASSVTDGVSKQSGANPGQVQVYEISIAGVEHLTLSHERSNMDTFSSLAFLLLFIVGAGKRYAEYVKEQ